MIKVRYALMFLAVLLSLDMSAQTAEPEATYTNQKGETVDDPSEGVSAPLYAHFAANPRDLDDYEARYEWALYQAGSTDTLKRFTENFDHVFLESGQYNVSLRITFAKGQDVYDWTMEEEGISPFIIQISESKLEFPNAFSPNGDGINDVFKAKDTYQSIVKFEATIFNRWGQKIYSWTDLEGGWDGKWHGKTVGDGCYFVVVHAQGADGKKYNIKRDVNVLTGIKKDESQINDN